MDSKARGDQATTSAVRQMPRVGRSRGIASLGLWAVGIIMVTWLAGQADVGGAEVILVGMAFVALLVALTALAILRPSPRHHTVRHRPLMYAASLGGSLLAALPVIALPLIATVVGYQARWLQELFAALAWIGLMAAVAALNVPRRERERNIR